MSSGIDIFVLINILTVELVVYNKLILLKVNSWSSSSKLISRSRNKRFIKTKS